MLKISITINENINNKNISIAQNINNYFYVDLLNLTPFIVIFDFNKQDKVDDKRLPKLFCFG